MAVEQSTSHPLDSLPPDQRALLRILCWVAWADGDVSEEERGLLERIMALLSVGEQPADSSTLGAENLKPDELEQLVEDLGTADQRQLAVKLAFQMVASSRRPADDALISTAEKGAYRQLLLLLNLPESEVQEAEWAARQELQRPRGLAERISEILSGFGAWPPLEGSQLPLSERL